MFATILIDWYQLHKRDLPWRNTSDPYKIWLSEIMLQQTRVDQGLSYFLKFVDHYPTIVDLANATEQQVLNDWQGLGYYSRARNLHATAIAVATQYEGKFPTTYAEIIQLKGVGAYTAAAIASFAFNEPKAVVDGNVYRVLARYFDTSTPIDSTQGKKEFQQLADELLPHPKNAVYNQAIMEFGALQCVPVNPSCDTCVLNNNCQAYLNKTVNQRPVKTKKVKVRNRYFYYAIFESENNTCIQKREQNDIWQHLYEFPLFETTTSLTDEELLEYYYRNYQLKPAYISTEIKHVLSHQRIITRFLHFSEIPQKLQAFVVSKDELVHYPLPRLIEKYLENQSK